MSASYVLGMSFMLGGCFFIFVAALGTLRLPDVYCRSHAVGKAMTLGIMLVMIGYGLFVPGVPWLKIVVALLFQFVTIPVASHLLCLIAYRKGVRRWQGPQVRA
jgi:multicomponent Na+:H+ antiporter subunit G